MPKRSNTDHLVTSAELTAKLLNDPEWVAAKRARDLELEKKVALIKEIEAPLEQELKDSGINVRNYRDIIDRPANFRVAIPILVRHMQMDRYSDLTRNFMAQAIAMKETNAHWSTLVQLFREANGTRPIFAEGLAVALSKAWKPPQLEELINLCEDESLGDIRVLLVNGLRRSKDVRADVTLLKLSDSPKIGQQVKKWL